MAGITLYQFPASHYNEKVRWALDLKGVPHDRVSLLPGPHAPRMKRLTRCPCRLVRSARRTGRAGRTRVRPRNRAALRRRGRAGCAPRKIL